MSDLWATDGGSYRGQAQWQARHGCPLLVPQGHRWVPHGFENGQPHLAVDLPIPVAKCNSLDGLSQQTLEHAKEDFWGEGHNLMQKQIPRALGKGVWPVGGRAVVAE